MSMCVCVCASGALIQNAKYVCGFAVELNMAQPIDNRFHLLSFETNFFLLPFSLFGNLHVVTSGKNPRCAFLSLNGFAILIDSQCSHNTNWFFYSCTALQPAQIKEEYPILDKNKLLKIFPFFFSVVVLFSQCIVSIVQEEETKIEKKRNGKQHQYYKIEINVQSICCIRVRFLVFLDFPPRNTSILQVEVVIFFHWWCFCCHSLSVHFYSMLPRSFWLSKMACH